MRFNGLKGHRYGGYGRIFYYSQGEKGYVVILTYQWL
jgi:hypothetical protein